MGMRYFLALTGMRLDFAPLPIYREPRREANRNFRMPTAKEITLAECNTDAMGAVTAHRLADYRRKQFSLVLLPNVHITLDDMLFSKEDSDVHVQM